MSRLLLSGCACAALALSASASASVVTMDAYMEMSGSESPRGPVPWVTASFDDVVVPGYIRLTLSTPGLVDTEYVTVWAFNLDPTLDPALITSSLTIDAQSTPTVGAASVTKGANSFSADGAGDFDFKFTFPTAPTPDRFGAGETATFLISGIPTLDVFSFQTLSTKGYEMAAHIQSIGTDGEGSGWVTTPEPAAAALLLTPLLMLKRSRKQPS